MPTTRSGRVVGSVGSVPPSSTASAGGGKAARSEGRPLIFNVRPPLAPGTYSHRAIQRLNNHKLKEILTLPFIARGYRLRMSAWQLFYSLFQLHNETFNVSL